MSMSSVPAADVVKRCPCSQTFTRSQWHSLPFVGIQKVDAYEEEPEERLELRNCYCGSTISMPVKK